MESRDVEFGVKVSHPEYGIGEIVAWEECKWSFESSHVPTLDDYDYTDRAYVTVSFENGLATVHRFTLTMCAQNFIPKV